MHSTKRGIVALISGVLLLAAASCGRSGLPPAQSFSGDSSAQIMSVSWSPDGRRVAAGGYSGAVRIWNVIRAAQDRVLDLRAGPILRALWSPTGHRLAVVTEKRLELLDTETGNVVRSLETSSLVYGLGLSDIAWSHDGRRLATAGWLDAAVRVFDGASGREVSVLRGHREGASTVAWSPDDHFLASGGMVGDGTIRIWDPARDKQLELIDAHTNNWLAVAWSPNGDALAWHGYSDPVVHLWDTVTRRERLTMHQRYGEAALSWSPGRGQLVTVDETGILRLWNAQTGAEDDSLGSESSQFTVVDVASSPDGGRLAVAAGGRITVWEVATRGIQYLDVSHPTAQSELLHIAWSPDGAWIAGGFVDGSVRLWQLARTR